MKKLSLGLEKQGLLRKVAGKRLSELWFIGALLIALALVVFSATIIDDTKHLEMKALRLENKAILLHNNVLIRLNQRAIYVLMEIENDRLREKIAVGRVLL